MNVLKCSGKRGSLRCVFQRIEIDEETGEINEIGCAIKQSDEYNIYPEFKSDSGDVIYQNQPVITKDRKVIFSTDVDPVGKNIIWENITNHHQDGNSFDFRRFPADIHPLYHIVKQIIPTKSGNFDIDTIGEVIGDENLSLVSIGWTEDKSYGKPIIEKCSHCLLGRFDYVSRTIIHRSMKDYCSDVLGWINFTKFKNRVKKKILFLMDAHDQIIENYCMELFPDTKASNRMIEIMKAIREGEYINLREAAINNGLTTELASKMMQDVSLRSKKTVYKGTVNIQKIYELYEYIGKMGFDGNYVIIYRTNIVNYLLNYPELEKIVLGLPRYQTNQRYWFLYLILKKAYKRDKIIEPDKLPKWIVEKIKDMKSVSPTFNLFGKEVKTTNCSKEEQDIHQEAFAYNLQQPSKLFPAMSKIEDILGNDYKYATNRKRSIFNRIILAGIRWNRVELKTTWNKFQRAYKKRNPRSFWNFIEELHGLDFKEFSIRMESDGNPGIKKVCFSNLIDARSPFKGMANWEVEIPPITSNIAASAKHKAKFKSRKNMFWHMLTKIGGLTEDKNSNKEILPDDKIDRLIEKEQRKDEIIESFTAPSDEQMLDTDEYENFSEYDPSIGSTNPMIIRSEGDLNE